jgi:hypothetical protein
VGSHLKVDLDLLEDTADALEQLRAEFADASQIADDYRGVLGSGEVADAVDDFVGNWRRHREKLINSIESLETMAEDSARTYREVDSELADSVQPPGGAPAGGPR